MNCFFILLILLSFININYALKSSITNFLNSGIDVEFDGEINYISNDYSNNFINEINTYDNNSLPLNWDWSKEGKMTTVLNQHIPQYCGSCWAHATVSTIADRIKIKSNGTLRDIIPSVQVLLNCGEKIGTCNGGDIHAAMRWIQQNSIPDITCQQYVAKDLECSAETTCMTCSGRDGCSAIKEYPKIELSDYGRVIGDDNIMKEIVNNGPVACYINSDCIKQYTSGISMYNETYDGGKCHPYKFDHAIQLSGYGIEDGVEYWIGRNSWGTYYGESGFFRVVRGGAYNPIGCYYVTPVLPVL